MRIAVWLAMTLALQAYAQAPAKKPAPKEVTRMLQEMATWESQWRQRESIEKRAWALRPARRDTPLRYLNISDEEVREVQSVSAKYLPRAMVNISPVVTDCPCEEGPDCTAQVYLLASKDDKTRGLQLSRVRDHWTVGVVQRWWLRRDALRMADTGNELVDRYEFARALHDLNAEFPMCVGELVPVTGERMTKK